jgi:hypothetical protein
LSLTCLTTPIPNFSAPISASSTTHYLLPEDTLSILQQKSFLLPENTMHTTSTKMSTSPPTMPASPQTPLLATKQEMNHPNMFGFSLESPEMGLGEFIFDTTPVLTPASDMADGSFDSPPVPVSGEPISPDILLADLSPLSSFGSDAFAPEVTNKEWFSLFPTELAVAAMVPPLPTVPAVTTPPTPVIHSDSLLHSRKHSHSLVAGVNARRRDKPLPPIVVSDMTDTAAIKRAKNTLAARKSRERKADRLESLEKEVSELKDEVKYWKSLAISAART